MQSCRVGLWPARERPVQEFRAQPRASAEDPSEAARTQYPPKGPSLSL